MVLDELKLQWNVLDENVRASQQINEKLLRSMLTERSRGTLAEMQGKIGRLAIFFSALLAGFGAILAGNPFDYTHWLHYLPATLYMLVVLAALITVVAEYLFLRRTSITGSNLRDSLTAVIATHERYKRLINVIWKLSLAAGFLLGISLLAPRFETYGTQKVAWVITVQALTVLGLYKVARWLLGNLPDLQLNSLRETLAELEA